MTGKLKITFFCALKYQDFKDSNYFYIFRNILLNSIERNFRVGDIAEFIVACPGKEISAIKDLFSKSPIPHRVLDEKEVCPEFKNSPIDGYKKQMILKLAIADFIDTDFYLIVDPDVILIRKSSLNNLIVDGKPRLGLNTDCHFYHNFWLENAIEGFYLNSDKEKKGIKQGRRIMGITPQIFITEIAKQCVVEINEHWGGNSLSSSLLNLEESFKERYRNYFVKIELMREQAEELHKRAVEATRHGIDENAKELSDMVKILHSRLSLVLLKLHHAWTEYSLYWAYILKNGLQEKYERDLSLHGNVYSGKKWGLYTTDEIPDISAIELENDLIAGNVFAQEEPFVVIQSTAGHNIADLESILMKYNII